MGQDFAHGHYLAPFHPHRLTLLFLLLYAQLQFQLESILGWVWLKIIKPQSLSFSCNVIRSIGLVARRD